MHATRNNSTITFRALGVGQPEVSVSLSSDQPLDAVLPEIVRRVNAYEHLLQAARIALLAHSNGEVLDRGQAAFIRGAVEAATKEHA